MYEEMVSIKFLDSGDVVSIVLDKAIICRVKALMLCTFMHCMMRFDLIRSYECGKTTSHGNIKTL